MWIDDGIAASPGEIMGKITKERGPIFPRYLPRRAFRATSSLRDRGRKLAAELAGIRVWEMRYAFYFATQTVRRSMTKNIGDPGKNSAEGQHPRETPRNFRRARIMEEDARVALVYYGHRARFSLRDDDATKLIRPRRTEGLLGRIERKLSLRVYPRRRYIQHTMHPRCNYVPIPRARFPRSCSLPARANRRENPRLLPRRLTPPLAQER